MDFTKFINSEDIREYHRAIGYRYNSLEAAWLVYFCRNVSIKENHEAWNWIIENMEDVEITNAYKDLKGKKLHEMLRAYMELESAGIKQFFEEDTCDKIPHYIYTIQEYTKMWDGKKEWYDVKGFFSYVDKCMEYIKAEIADEGAEDIEEVSINKIMETDKTDFYDHIEAVFRPDGTIMKMYYEVDNSERQNKNDYCIRYFFDRMWFYFPVPFKKGDIVTLKQIGDPIVVDNIIFPDETEKESFLKRKQEGGDNSAMVVWGFFMHGCKDSSGNEFLGLSWDYFWNYMDVEYYRENLTGLNKCLQPVSAFLKNEITLDLAITAYHSLFTGENAERYKGLMYTEKGMEIAGLKKDDIAFKN